jgi:hypothetical protein
MPSKATEQTGIYAAILLIAGTLISGPIGLLIVQSVHPQPPWQDAATYVANYHPIQVMPFFAGFLLVLGSCLLIATLYRLSAPTDKARALLAVMCTAAFSGLIFFNYICQTTFLPALVADYRPQYDAIITALSFSNPRSLCWAIEMWGYALLGLATWLLAAGFRTGMVEKVTGSLMVANGVLSIAGGFISAVDLAWVMSLPGLVNYIVWNVLMIVWGVFVIWSLQRRSATVHSLMPLAGSRS